MAHDDTYLFQRHDEILTIVHGVDVFGETIKVFAGQTHCWATPIIIDDTCGLMLVTSTLSGKLFPSCRMKIT